MAKKLTKPDLSPADLSQIVAMALSDHISFSAICEQFSLSADAVREVMRNHLKPGSYRAWRERVRLFSDRRELYKQPANALKQRSDSAKRVRHFDDAERPTMLGDIEDP
jgi:uncharacterized protein (TIGR03643 family)